MCASGSLAVKSNLVRDFTDFVCVCFGSNTGITFTLKPHHRLIIKALIAVLSGQTTRLIINIPPRYGKTELMVYFMGWCLGIRPDSKFIHTSYTQKLATTNSQKVRELVLSDAYRLFFPTFGIKADTKAKTEWHSTEGGGIYAVGSLGSITGYGAGTPDDRFGGGVIIDDPHKASEVGSEVKRNAVIDWYMSTIPSRLNSKDTPIVLIMQRLHMEDLSGFLLNGGTGEKWHHIKIPALDKDDKPLWSARHSKAKLYSLREVDPYNFSSQYMQEPIIKGGNLIKDEWLHIYDDVKAWEYRIITADTAQKTGQHNDYSVFQLWGYFQKQAYLIDQIRGKWEMPALRQNAVSFWNKHVTGRGTLRAMHVEDQTSGTSLMQDIRMDGVPVRPIKRSTDKVSRANDILSYLASGLVWLPKSHFTDELVAELLEFNHLMTHRHDDQVDCFVDGVHLLLANKKVSRVL